MTIKNQNNSRERIVLFGRVWKIFTKRNANSRSAKRFFRPGNPGGLGFPFPSALDLHHAMQDVHMWRISWHHHLKCSCEQL